MLPPRLYASQREQGQTYIAYIDQHAMAYRLLRAVWTKGNIALQDGRHGHPYNDSLAQGVRICCRQASKGSMCLSLQWQPMHSNTLLAGNRDQLFRQRHVWYAGDLETYYL